MRAATNYNGVIISLRLLTDAGGSFASANGCDIDIANPTGDFAATLRLEIFAPATGGDSARGLTVDYDLRIVSPAAARDARDAFVERIEAGDFDWYSTDLISAPDGTFDDWDDDDISNPYDWTPTSIDLGDGRIVGVNLTLDGSPDGSAENPWSIYNVWQLQAIDGRVVSEKGVFGNSSALFGSGRLGLQYRLAVDIDAARTRLWATSGFDPIGGVFTGGLDGEGREIRGLYVNNANSGALFSNVGSGGRVARLGLPDIEVSAGAGGSWAAGVVGQLNGGAVVLVWASGMVRNRSSSKRSNGGLVGHLRDGEIRESWFVGDVIGRGQNGGLVGLFDDRMGVVENSWAMARVLNSGHSNGGLIGRATSNRTPDVPILRNSWSGGPVASGQGSGGIVGAPIGDESLLGGSAVYLDSSTSGVSKIGVGARLVAFVVETMVTVNSRLGSAWEYGGAAAYPFLDRAEDLWPGAQALAYANFQTRIFSAAGDQLPTGGQMNLAAGANIMLTLDTNGRATGAPTPVPTCAADADGVIVAKTNYNNVTIRLRATGDGSAVFTTDCEIVVAYADADSTNVSVDALIATGETTISGWSQLFNVDLNEEFVEEVAAGDFDWFSDDKIIEGVGSSVDWDGDNIANVYDWTPIIGVDLTASLTGPGGTADNRWPVYNIWQLQAIDGVVPVDATAGLSPRCGERFANGGAKSLRRGFGAAERVLSDGGRYRRDSDSELGRRERF